MAKMRRIKRPPPRSAGWRWASVVAVLLIGIGAAALWWRSEAQNPSGGTPRLVVDRTEIDLGYFPFEARAKAVFTLTNAGDGLLRLVEVPPVQAVKGC